VNDFIERRGGGLIILGSNDHSGSILSRSSGLAHLSPANLASGDVSNSKGEGATFLAPTDEGIAEGLFHSRTDGDDFEKLGPISTSYLKVGSLKPGAKPFATDSSIAGPQSPVLVAGQTYGLGRTLLVSPSDSWRAMLATESDEQNHFATFWQSLTFWASGGAEPRSYISIASPSIRQGEGLTAYLTARDEAFNPLASLTIEAEIEVTSSDGEGTVEKLPLIVEQVADAPEAYRLSSGGLSEGRGVLRVRVQTPGREGDDLSLAFDLRSEDWRLRETPDLLDRLEQAAVESGGRVFGIQETDRLITRLMGLETGSVPVQYTFKLRDSVALAFILPLLFATEYLLRRVMIERPRGGEG
jgi:hypothetical protein